MQIHKIKIIKFDDDILPIIKIQKGGKPCTQIQSIIFEKKKFKSEDARKWLKKYGYKPIKRVDKTKNFLRYRIREPKKRAIYRTINFGDNIKAVLEILTHCRSI